MEDIFDFIFFDLPEALIPVIILYLGYRIAKFIQAKELYWKERRKQEFENLQK